MSGTSPGPGPPPGGGDPTNQDASKSSSSSSLTPSNGVNIAKTPSAGGDVISATSHAKKPEMETKWIQFELERTFKSQNWNLCILSIMYKDCIVGHYYLDGSCVRRNWDYHYLAMDGYALNFGGCC